MVVRHGAGSALESESLVHFETCLNDLWSTCCQMQLGVLNNALFATRQTATQRYDRRRTSQRVQCAKLKCLGSV